MINPILFLDVETTGLEPDADILEIGIILTQGPELEIVWCCSWLVRHRWAALAAAGLRPLVHPTVAEMHEKSGLWAACAWSTRGERPKQDTAHRALADCAAARAELLRYMPLFAPMVTT